jgi:integrase
MGRNGTGVTPRATSIQVSFTIDGQHRRLTLKTGGEPMRPTPVNVKYAERLVAEIRQKIALGVFTLAEYFPEESGTGDGTLSALLDDWLKTLRAPKSTVAKYTSAAKFWKVELGKKLARLLKPSDIRKAIAAHPGLSGKTINDYTSVLRRALDEAMDDKVIQSNPASKIDALPHQAPPVDPFSQAEAEKIIAKIREQSGDDAADFTEFRFFTGLRTGEALGLQWGNIDLKRRHMIVAEALVRGEHKDSTKTSKARTVDLNSRALAALMRQKPRTYLAGKHVFLNHRTGEAYSSEKQFNDQTWKPALKALTIRYRRPYNTRHTYATMMLMAGLTPAYCANQLGHSIEMFLRTYAKWLDGERNAIEQSQLEQFLGVIPGVIVEDSKGSQG